VTFSVSRERERNQREEEEGRADGWGLLVSEERRGTGYRFGFCFLGRGLDLELGQIVSPRAFYIFILLCFFSFLFFFFLLFSFSVF
jgi:hypothetical protein